jgi:hypothetical protein
MWHSLLEELLHRTRATNRIPHEQIDKNSTFILDVTSCGWRL